MTYAAKVHKTDADNIVVASGGKITIDTGGEFECESVVYSLTDSSSITEINAGKTLLAAVAGRTITVVGWSMTAVGGAAGAATAVTLSDTAGSPVLIGAVAVAALTEGVVVLPSSTNVTDGAAGIGLGLTAAKGITIEKTGSTLTTLTSITVTIQYTIA